MKLTLATVVALFLLASSSGAEPAFQCPQPGTVIAYSDGSSLTFTDQAGMTCHARTKTGLLAPLYLGLILPGADLEKNQGEHLLPLRVGSEITFMSSSPTANATGNLVDTVKEAYFDNTVKVVGQEKLVTAAGAFDTFVIEWHRQVRGRWSGAWVATVWLAPELGSTVKFKFETRQGYGRDLAYEITSLTLPTRNAAPTDRAAPAAEAQAAATETVTLEQVGGTFRVPAQVNGGITLSFVLDTGASDVAIPADVVQMLTRAGTVSSRDFMGTKTYVMADGSKLPGEAFTLHELTVGNHTIKNVIAHVAPVQGQLLLGQSLLSQLPAWTIDYKQHALVISSSAGALGAGATAPPATPAQMSAVVPMAAAPPPATPAPAPPPAAPKAASAAFLPSPPVPVSASPPPATVAAQPAVVATVPVTRAVARITGDIAFKCPRSGTIVEYSNGTTLKFGGGSGLRCAYMDQAYKEREKFGVFADDAKFLDAGLDKLWPLTTGKEQTIGVSVSGGYLRQHFAVLRTETVATPAGSFDTVAVEQEESGVGAQTAKRLFWYAPELGLIVKSTFTLVRATDAASRATGYATATLIPGDYQAVRIEVPSRP